MRLPGKRETSGGIEMPKGKGASRRSFLKLGGAVALLSTLERGAEAAEGSRPAIESRASSSPAPKAGTSRLVDLVNPLQGTDSTALLSRGNTLPIVAVPFAMAHWALQSSDRNAWFFQPHDQRLQGIRCTHQLSMWLGDYGQATFMPFTGDPDPEPTARASSYRPKDLRIAPRCLKVPLLRYGCTLELAPTERCSAMRFTFKESGAAESSSTCPARAPRRITMLPVVSSPRWSVPTKAAFPPGSRLIMRFESTRRSRSLM